MDKIEFQMILEMAQDVGIYFDKLSKEERFLAIELVQDGKAKFLTEVVENGELKHYVVRQRGES